MYSVLWSQKAEDALAESWLDASNRNSISIATAFIETALGQRPFRVGNPLGSSVNRHVVIPPLGIVFDIIEDDKKVIVQSCWLAG